MARSASQCIGCGVFSPRRMRDPYRGESPVRTTILATAARHVTIGEAHAALPFTLLHPTRVPEGTRLVDVVLPPAAELWEPYPRRRQVRPQRSGSLSTSPPAARWAAR